MRGLTTTQEVKGHTQAGRESEIPLDEHLADRASTWQNDAY